MSNIRGVDGIINRTGTPGAPSDIVDCRDDFFWDNIEDGIRSTVKAIVDKGFLTVSSCEGHASSCPFRCVSIICEEEDIRWFQLAISKINDNLDIKVPIMYALLDKQPAFCLYNNDFHNPKIIDISFGHFDSLETHKKQKAFEIYLRDHTSYKIFEELNERITTPFMHNEAHYDVFT